VCKGGFADTCACCHPVAACQGSENCWTTRSDFHGVFNV
jgi:hypothetical protein